MRPFNHAVPGRHASLYLIAATAVLALAACFGGSAPAWAACQTTTQVVPPATSFTNTGCISTTNIDAVDAGPNSTVINAAGGTVTITSSVILTNAITATGGSNTITNNGLLTVVGTNGNFSLNGIEVSGDSNVVTNNGTIIMNGGLEAITTNPVLPTSNTTAINNGSIQLQNGAGFGIEITGNGNNNLAINNGSILMTSGGGGSAMIFRGGGGGFASLINNGSITDVTSASPPAFLLGLPLIGSGNIGMECFDSCSSLNAASGVIAFGTRESIGISGPGNATVTNDGLIQMTGSYSVGIYTAGSGNSVSNHGAIVLSGANSWGLLITDINTPGSSGTFTNSGSITVTGQGSYGVAFGTNFFDTGASNNTFFNSGLIKAGPGAIAVGDLTSSLVGANPSFNSVINTGTIDGQISLSQGTFESLTNSGLITISYPGSGITHSIDGTFTQTATGTLALRVDANGGNDKLSVIGVANLAGTLQVLAQIGNYAPSTTYTVVTATNGVNGTFANVFTNLAFLTPKLTYDADDAFLTLTRNMTFFCSIAQTQNQKGPACALDKSPITSPLVLAVVNQTNAGARQAFDALSGEIHATLQTAILDDSFYVRQAILGRLRQASFADGEGPAAALGWGGPALAYVQSDAPALAYADPSRPAFPVKAPVARPDDVGLAFWAQALGAWGHINADGNAAEASRTLGGFFTGVDRRFGDWRAGFAAGYTNSSVDIDARASSAHIDTAVAAAYAGTSFGPWNFRSGAAFAWNTISTNRAIIFPGFVDTATARYDAGEEQVFGEIGYGMTFGRVAAEPFAGLAYVHLHTGSFNEVGGIAALNGFGNNEDVGYATLGARLASAYVLQNGTVLIPRASLAWQHAFDDVNPAAALAFQSTGVPFGIVGLPIARDEAVVEAGLDARVNPRATIGISYLGQLASTGQDHSVRGNFTWRF
jgi:outer membrane autotransporter protein